MKLLAFIAHSDVVYLSAVRHNKMWTATTVFSIKIPCFSSNSFWEFLYFLNVFHRNPPVTHQDTEHVLYFDHETATNKYSATPQLSPLNHAQYQHVVKRLYFTSSDRLAGRLHTKSCIQLNCGVLCRTCLYNTAFLLDQFRFCKDKIVSFYMRLTGPR